MASTDKYFRAPDQPLISKNWRYFGFVNGACAAKTSNAVSLQKPKTRSIAHIRHFLI
jgi:hypothetical protein